MFDSIRTTLSGDLLQCTSEEHSVNTLNNCGPDHLFDEHAFEVFVDRTDQFGYTTLSLRKSRNRKNNNHTQAN